MTFTLGQELGASPCLQNSGFDGSFPGLARSLWSLNVTSSRQRHEHHFHILDSRGAHRGRLHRHHRRGLRHARWLDRLRDRAPCRAARQPRGRPRAGSGSRFGPDRWSSATRGPNRTWTGLPAQRSQIERPSTTPPTPGEIQVALKALKANALIQSGRRGEGLAIYEQLTRDPRLSESEQCETAYWYAYSLRYSDKHRSAALFRDLLDRIGDDVPPELKGTVGGANNELKELESSAN